MDYKNIDLKQLDKNKQYKLGLIRGWLNRHVPDYRTSGVLPPELLEICIDYITDIGKVLDEYYPHYIINGKKEGIYVSVIYLSEITPYKICYMIDGDAISVNYYSPDGENYR